jgi:hypothetical protein
VEAKNGLQTKKEEEKVKRKQPIVNPFLEDKDVFVKETQDWD